MHKFRKRASEQVLEMTLKNEQHLGRSVQRES
jgi:hypothetical protein